MPNLTLNWEIAGDVQLRRTLVGIARDLDDMREPLRRFGDKVVYTEARRQFAMEGEPPWPQLSLAYAAWKSQHFPGAKILHLTGGLEESLTDKADENAVYNLEKLSLEIGTAVQVGKYNLGLIHYKPEDPNRPPRQMLRLSPEAQTRGVMIFSEWLYGLGRNERLGS